MKMKKRGISRCFLSLVLCVALIFPFAIPAYASDTGLSDIGISLFDWIAGVGKDIGSWFVGKHEYDQKVEEIETEYGTSILDDTGALWLTVPFKSSFGNAKYFNVLSSSFAYPQSFSAQNIGNSYYSFLVYVDNAALLAPIDGFYSFNQVVPIVYCDGLLLPPNTFQNDYSFKSTYFTAGTQLFSSDESRYVSIGVSSAALFQVSIPWRVKCVPSSSVLPQSDTRVGTFSGNFGYYGSDGQLIVSDNVNLVDEVNKTVYNPVTGDTTTVTDWTYDYSDRSYNVTTESGDTITITYGDEQVTYVQGDTTYNIYYVTNGSGGDDPSPSPCVHNWEVVAGGRQDPTCTVAGYQDYKCSLCSETKRETLAALGHTWIVKQTVTTEYDENGNLLQQGYTIYQCSACGEEYKDVDGTGPPIVDDGDDPGGGNWFTDFFGKLGELLGSFFGGLVAAIGNVILGILDGLLSLVTTAVSKLADIVNLFGTFGEALGVLWSWLPPDIVSVLVSGVIVVIFVALLKIFL